MRWTKRQRVEILCVLAACALVVAGCSAVQVKVITGTDLSSGDIGQTVQSQVEAALGQTDILEKLVEAQPQSPEALLALGLAYQRDGNSAQAVDVLTQALALDPARFDVYRWRAEAYAALGRYEEAIADLTAALDLEPQNADLLRRRGDFLQQSGQPAAALADYRTYLALADPDGNDSELLAWFEAVETALSSTGD